MKSSLSLLPLFFCAFGWSQPLPFDVLQYDYTLELRDGVDSLSAHAVLDVRRAALGTSVLKLNLVGRSGSTGMSVSTVAVDGLSTAAFRHTGDTLYIPISQAVGSRFRVSIAYSGIPADGLIHSKNQYGSRTFFGDNWPNRARNWLACIDAPRDKARFTFRVYAPEGYCVIANGLRKIHRHVRGQNLYVYQTQHPIPTKTAAIGVAVFAVERVAEAPVPISSWVYPENRVVGFKALRTAPGIVDFFSRRIAPFPFAKLANVQSTTRYGGMENASCIFYNQGAFEKGRNVNGLIAHEVVHQWFGNSVTERDFRHLWLSEGFATYLTQLYLEKKYGTDTLKSFLKEAQLQINAFKKRFPKAVLVPQKVSDPNRMLNVYSYQKGAWLLHMVRVRIGLQKFWAVLRAFYRAYRYANADTEDFITLLERETGRDFKALFDLYAYRSKLPAYKLEWAYDPVAKTVTGKLSQTVAGLDSLPIELGIQSSEGKWVYRSLRSGVLGCVFTVKNQREKPRVVVLDPRYKALRALCIPPGIERLK